MADLTQALIEQVRDAHASGTTLEIRGAGSKQFMGRSASADATIDIAGHRGIVKYDPVELVLTARAGTPLREIHSVLDENHQMLAFEPPHFATGATLGGTLACNQSGPARPWGGSVRDAVLGIRLINGRGEYLRFGGQVMKNVAGYDVSRAQAGAMGTLGVMTEISLKVMPKPVATTTLVQELAASDAIVKMNTLAGQPQPLMGACWQNGKLYLRLAGVNSAVTSTVNRWGGTALDQADDFWESLKEHQQPFFTTDAPLWRFSVNSSANHWHPEADWIIDWGGAQRWLKGNFDQSQLEQEAKQAGGQVGLFRGGDRTGEVFATQAPALQLLHQRLKNAFDPVGIFNPGRLYSWM